MATSGGFGLIYKINIVSTLTTIPKVIEGTLPGRELVMAEVTAHDSTGGYKEQIASGKRSLGEWDFTVLWNSTDATHQAVLTAFKAAAPTNSSVTKPGATEIVTMSTHYTKMKVTTDIEDGVKIQWTCKGTGAPTVT
jgi:predicted secreted protein